MIKAREAQGPAKKRALCQQVGHSCNLGGDTRIIEEGTDLFVLLRHVRGPAQRQQQPRTTSAAVPALSLWTTHPHHHPTTGGQSHCPHAITHCTCLSATFATLATLDPFNAEEVLSQPCPVFRTPQHFVCGPLRQALTIALNAIRDAPSTSLETLAVPSTVPAFPKRLLRPGSLLSSAASGPHLLSSSARRLMRLACSLHPGRDRGAGPFSASFHRHGPQPHCPFGRRHWRIRSHQSECYAFCFARGAQRQRHPAFRPIVVLSVFLLCGMSRVFRISSSRPREANRGGRGGTSIRRGFTLLEGRLCRVRLHSNSWARQRCRPEWRKGMSVKFYRFRLMSCQIFDCERVEENTIFNHAGYALVFVTRLGCEGCGTRRTMFLQNAYCVGKRRPKPRHIGMREACGS